MSIDYRQMWVILWKTLSRNNTKQGDDLNWEWLILKRNVLRCCHTRPHGILPQYWHRVNQPFIIGNLTCSRMKYKWSSILICPCRTPWQLGHGFGRCTLRSVDGPQNRAPWPLGHGFGRCLVSWLVSMWHPRLWNPYVLISQTYKTESQCSIIYFNHNVIYI